MGCFLLEVTSSGGMGARRWRDAEGRRGSSAFAEDDGGKRSAFAQIHIGNRDSKRTTHRVLSENSRAVK